MSSLEQRRNSRRPRYWWLLEILRAFMFGWTIGAMVFLAIMFVAEGNGLSLAVSLLCANDLARGRL